MQVKDMHIEVSQATQNIAAAVRRKLLPQEIDWLLNKNQYRFIQARSKPRIDERGQVLVDQMDIDSLRTLVSPWEQRAIRTKAHVYEVELPDDYLSLVSSESATIPLCGNTEQVLSSASESIVALPLKFTTAAQELYKNITITLNAVETTMAQLAAQFQASYTGMSSKHELWTLKDILLWYLREVRGYTVYWERYRNLYRPHHLLVVGTNAGSISIDGQLSEAEILTHTFEYFNLNGTKSVANRLIGRNLSEMLRTPFYTTHPESPLSEVDQHRLKVYGDDRFIVTKVHLEYLRKPRPINVNLNQDCELAEEFHQAICDLTAEYIRGMTADPNWEIKLKDNMMRSVPLQ